MKDFISNQPASRYWGRWTPLRALLFASLLTACSEPMVRTPSPGAHIQAEPAPAKVELPLLRHSALPKPGSSPSRKPALYSVAVENVPVRELLFAIARDARLEADISTAITGNVTMNAREKPLTHLLERIAEQVPIAWEVRDGVLRVSPDQPVWKPYRVDYINVRRSVESNISASNQITGVVSTGGGGGGSSGGGSSGGGNVSVTALTASNEHAFWNTLTNTLNQILATEAAAAASQGGDGAAASAAPAGGPAASPGGASPAANPGGAAPSPTQATPQGAEASAAASGAGTSAAPQTPRVVVNPEAGLVMVYATERQHRRVRDYLQRVQASVGRQVLIEATVVEVRLNENAESGIDWRQVATGAGFTMRTNFMRLDLDNFTPGNNPLTGNSRGIVLGYGNDRSYALALQLLSEYGRVKVLSSPKVSTLNNQPALLRVVDNLVYFTVSQQTSQGGGGSGTVINYTTTPNTVAIGFTMSVTPQIDDSGVITLAIRPTITRLNGYARDPNPDLNLVPNLVPVVQTREIDTVMKLPSGAVAMMGGLMEDTETRRREGVPGLSSIEGLGTLFGLKSSGFAKTELAIFLRPVLIEDPRIEGSYAHVGRLLPDEHFFNQPWHHSLEELLREEGVQR